MNVDNLVNTREIENSVMNVSSHMGETLYKYAISKGKSISILDVVIWVVMRLAQREFEIWQW
ncbi:hypothetical protein ES703_18577 [subsurface metagenome]